MGFWAAIAPYVVNFIIAILISAAIAYVTAKDPEQAEATFDSADTAKGLLANTKTTEAVLPLIYGKCRVGINIVYIGTSGTDNQYLYIVGELGEGPINGIAQEDGVDQVFLDGELWTKWGSSYVHYEIFTGTATQNVCATLNSAIPEFTDPMRYTAYIYVRLKYDKDKFVQMPDITVTIEGLKLYDPDADTTAYSNNCALAVYDMLTRPSVRGGLGLDAWGGPVPGNPRIEVAAIESARAYCAAKGWTANMPINQNDPVTDNIQLILNCFRGGIIYSENKFKLKFRDLNYEGAPVMALDENDVLASGNESSLRLKPNADLFSRPNAIKVTFLNAAKKHIEDVYVFSDSAAIAADGDYREREIKILGLSNLSDIQKMAYYYLERWRWGSMANLDVVSRALALEPYDLVSLTHNLPGWDEQTLRVITPGIDAAGNVQLTALEEKSELYDDDYNPAPSNQWHDTNLPDPLAAVASVINVSHAEEVYFYRGRSFTRWKIDFDPPLPASFPFWDYAEIWVKIGTGDWRYMTKSTSDYILDPVEEGEAYYVKIRSVSIHGVKEDFNSAQTVSKTIVGKTAAPTDLVAMTAIANGDSVTIFATPITDPDIEGYEVRLGAAWDGGIFISFNKNCSLRLNGVRPGTHTFWMAPKDNAGNYAETPVSATTTVFVPPGYSELATYGSWAWDYTAGTHDNTEHTTYSGEDALKCSHVSVSTQIGYWPAGYWPENFFPENYWQYLPGPLSEALTGTWTSPTYDMNSIEKVRVWGDFRTDFISTDTTWDGVAPNPITWDDLGADKTWNQIFQPAQAGQIRASLLHSPDNSNWDEIVFFELLCAEVEARYIKVEIEITDPTMDSNLYVRELNMLAYTGPQGA